MYDIVVEFNIKIFFDVVDFFYDVLLWFRLIGRYVVFLYKLYVRIKLIYYCFSNG